MLFTITSDSIRNSAMFHLSSLNSRFHNQPCPNLLSQLRGSLQHKAFYEAGKPGFIVSGATSQDQAANND
jgi:hypothetical protein